VLTAFLRAFRTPDLRKKLLFTLGIIALFRLGSTIPAPGIDYRAVQICVKAAGNGGVFGLVNLFSGGALLQLTVFALGIMPYITASIIIQLLVVVIPRLERLKQEGQAGQQKLTQYTRYLTVALGILQSTTIIALARTPSRLFGSNCTQAIIPDTSVFRMGTLVVTMTAGTAMIMWLGELITDRGIGNGMSILIFTSIAARFPTQGVQILKAKGAAVLTIVMLFGLAVVTFVVLVEQAQRRIPVQYAKRMIGRRMYGGTSTYLPMKINQAGVIPVIFASSLLYIPTLLSNLWTTNQGFQAFVQQHLTRGDDWIYLLTYFVLIIGFTYFYVAITFNPDEVADNMKKYGGFIPGIRPGRPTAEYLSFVGGSQQFPFGGTAILILVGVGLETTKQIESQLMLRNYEGFLR
jgi:preprotein translocase subunit SecY